MPIEVQTALLTAASALGGAAIGAFSALGVERKRLRIAARQSEYERRLQSLARFNAAAIQWADAILFVAGIERSDSAYEREYERARARADELREGRGYLEVLVGPEVLKHVQEVYVPSEATLRAAFGRRDDAPEGVRASFDEYRTSLQETLKVFRTDIDRLRSV